MITSSKQYARMNKEIIPKTNILKNCFCAFLVGGTICLLGQIITFLLIGWGTEEQTAKTVSTLSLVFLSSVLTIVGIYDKIANFGGAGTLVPITGFANAMVSPSIEYKKEGIVTGTGAKMFTIAGPVLTFGISAGVLYGAILYLAKIL